MSDAMDLPQRCPECGANFVETDSLAIVTMRPMRVLRAMVVPSGNHLIITREHSTDWQHCAGLCDELAVCAQCGHVAGLMQ